MTDRHINFRPYQVRAALDGRLSQTRRIIKPAPEFCGGGRAHDPQNWNDQDAWGWENYDEGGWDLLSDGYMGRPFYATGDRLWVREAWRVDAEWDDCPPREFDGADAIHYEADGEQRLHLWGNPFTPGRLRSPIHMPRFTPGCLRSPIHMPRWASRLTLTITDVRVQRLQEISRGDAMEEGCPFANMADGPNPRDWYRDIWNSIYGPDAWDRNPWVAAISFKAHRCNIDKIAARDT